MPSAPKQQVDTFPLRRMQKQREPIVVKEPIIVREKQNEVDYVQEEHSTVSSAIFYIEILISAKEFSIL